MFRISFHAPKVLVRRHAIDSEATARLLSLQRQRLGLTPHDLAEQLGTTARFILDLEAGREDFNVLEPKFTRQLLRLVRIDPAHLPLLESQLAS